MRQLPMPSCKAAKQFVICKGSHLALYEWCQSHALYKRCLWLHEAIETVATFWLGPLFTMKPCNTLCYCLSSSHVWALTHLGEFCVLALASLPLAWQPRRVLRVSTCEPSTLARAGLSVSQADAWAHVAVRWVVGVLSASLRIGFAIAYPEAAG